MVCRCGERVLEGYRADLAEGRACDSSDIYADDAVSHCLEDVAQLSVDTDELGCSAVAMVPIGAEIEFWVDYDTRDATGERKVAPSLPSSARWSPMAR